MLYIIINTVSIKQFFLQIKNTKVQYIHPAKHIHDHMHNEINKAIISMGSSIIRKLVNQHILSKRSIGLSDRFILFGWCKLDLPPRKHIIEASIRAKEMRRLIILITWLQGEPVLSAIREANLLYIVDADGPQPPVVAKTMGVKVPCLISRMRCSYSLLFPLSCFLQVVNRESDELDGANGLKILTSKKVCCLLFPQKPMALKSCLALSPFMADRPEGCSPVKG